MFELATSAGGTISTTAVSIGDSARFRRGNPVNADRMSRISGSGSMAAFTRRCSSGDGEPVFSCGGNEPRLATPRSISASRRCVSTWVREMNGLLGAGCSVVIRLGVEIDSRLIRENNFLDAVHREMSCFLAIYQEDELVPAEGSYLEYPVGLPLLAVFGGPGVMLFNHGVKGFSREGEESMVDEAYGFLVICCQRFCRGLYVGFCKGHFGLGLFPGPLAPSRLLGKDFQMLGKEF